MKKIKFLFITFLVFVICFCCSGCITTWFRWQLNNQKKHLISEMSKFEIEVEGYSMIGKSEWQNIQYEYGQENDIASPFKSYWDETKDTIINNTQIRIEHISKTEIKLYYDNKDVVLNPTVLEEKNNVFKESRKIWVNKAGDPTDTPVEDIFIAVFDNNLFIMTYTMIPTFELSYENEFPSMLFLYDLGTEQISYAGCYLEDLDNRAYAVIKSED